MIEAGWADEEVPREQLFDLNLDPEEGNNLADSVRHAGTREALQGRLEVSMLEARDPLMAGPVAPPRGACINEQSLVSPEEPTRIFDGCPDRLP